MATRNKLTHDAKTRERIKTSQIINRLQNHIDSENEIMSASQVNAARILLNKTLPDLSSVSLESPDGKGLVVTLNDTRGL